MGDGEGLSYSDDYGEGLSYSDDYGEGLSYSDDLGRGRAVAGFRGSDPYKEAGRAKERARPRNEPGKTGIIWKSGGASFSFGPISFIHGEVMPDGLGYGFPDLFGFDPFRLAASRLEFFDVERVVFAHLRTFRRTINRITPPITWIKTSLQKEASNFILSPNLRPEGSPRPHPDYISAHWP